MTDLITDEIVEAAARSDAAFDGRDFDRLGRADRERYLARSKATLSAALPMLVRAEREACAQIADGIVKARVWDTVQADDCGDGFGARIAAAMRDGAESVATAIRSRGEA